MYIKNKFIYILSFVMEYIPGDINSNQEKKDEYWVIIGKELCELVYTTSIINVIMSYSFGKSHTYTKNLEIDFIELQSILDDIIQSDYPKEVNSIFYNNKTIPLTHICYGLKYDTVHINENGQSEYFVLLLEQIKIKPKKHMKKLINDELLMIKEFIANLSNFVNSLLCKPALFNNKYGAKLKLEINKIKKKCELLYDIQETLSDDDCYVLLNN